MARYAIIRNGMVDNIVEADEEFATAEGWIEATGSAAIGAGYADGKFVPPPAAVAVPEVIPMLNAHLVMISEGRMPLVRQHIAAIADPIRRARAEAFLDQALTMQRDHELVRTITQALGKTEAEVDALFVAAAALEV
ncbi:hypothetical protein OU994_18040 [Pseudoduganella sp. SL102]|uniref:hypothetical protein n=1 Tax=Pseudoduganella sp. SL102 TaxID=2995154 RepID=UPI00248B70B3|nr:hypothetical protein [Pseudoduganella sp. SL102]WBS00222.1 hypothetical protein OU994_18040 [Pseudoduganella sp. SL102]